eukprot:3748474-Rhodomonas_salina.2
MCARLWCYALATACPVLAYAVLIACCTGLPGSSYGGDGTGQPLLLLPFPTAPRPYRPRARRTRSVPMLLP